MNHVYSDVLGQMSDLRAASDNMLAIDDIINGLSDAHAPRIPTGEELLEAHLGLVQQLGDLVVARRAYRANNRVLAMTDTLLNKLELA